MSDTLSIAEVLSKAADLIEPEGAWTQGAYSNDGAYCVIGALVKASPFALYYASRAVLEDCTSPICPAEWNDAPGRTQAEAVAKLREAAALARGEQGS